MANGIFDDIRRRSDDGMWRLLVYFLFFFFFPDLVNKVIMMNDCTMSSMVPIVG